MKLKVEKPVIGFEHVIFWAGIALIGLIVFIPTLNPTIVPAIRGQWQYFSGALIILDVLFVSGLHRDLFAKSNKDIQRWFTYVLLVGAVWLSPIVWVVLH